MDIDNINKLKKQIAELTAKLHLEYHTEYADWYPKFPWVLVYVLPREQRIGSLWVPGDAKHQNKVTLEGVVVRLWKADHLKVKSELEIGDHVLFPHYGGQPFSDRSAQEFRVVKEGISRLVDNSDIIDNGHIFAKLDYNKKEVAEEFWKELNKELVISGHRKANSKSEIFNRLNRNFVIYPNHSKTISGE